ncbi:hypothetical protein ELH85_03250 [Rhizobium ruizarguesonis]|nr:hypothetical protein ELI10_37360 [Rhizobium ruizarguesonis]TAX01571.1 hypothetical protein ELI09_37165 [Rhizobium ruizarguesonis]TAX03485.1 hypothetical protein ELI08_37240 [Rhizobium ruizarguesonis]TAY96759.1 hypothetical protein ELH85_03250 [Rhizobium ruizarguesonis]TBY89635.1 hypothetical protein E0H40_15780 [Rhizobium leguminosarum bv. viciae]
MRDAGGEVGRAVDATNTADIRSTGCAVVFDCHLSRGSKSHSRNCRCHDGSENQFSKKHGRFSKCHNIFFERVEKRPVQLSVGVIPEVNNVFVKLHTNEGLAGWGEASPFLLSREIINLPTSQLPSVSGS